MKKTPVDRIINKRALSFLLTLCLMLSFLGGLRPAARADSEPLPGIIKYNGEYIAHPRTVRDLFDADYYLERYPELKSALNLSGDVNELSDDEREILLTHFMEKGLKEKRTCSPYLNLVRYRAAHPELEKEFGDNWDKYVEYYFTVGRLKGHDPFVSKEDLRIQEWLWEKYGDEIDPEQDREYRDYWDDPDEDDEPRPLINRMARSSITGYQLYANPNGTGRQAVNNAYFSGWFYPEVYQSILNDPRRGDGTPEYTVMIYLCGTDLEDRNGSASKDLINALAAQYDLSRVNVLVLAGGTMCWNNKVMQQNNNGVNLCLYYLDPGGVRNGAGSSAGGEWDEADWSQDNVDNILTGDTADRKGSLRLLASYDQVCMGDSELLLGFLDTAYDLFPADHYWLSLWNHGTGCAGGICAGDPVSREYNEEAYRGIDISSSPLTLAKIEEALNCSKIVKERGDLDILSLDACLMAGIEGAYNFSPYVRFLIASEEMTSGDVPFDKYLGMFKAGGEGSTMSAGELAVNAAKSYMAAKSGSGRNAATMSVYDLATLDECADRMNAFGYAVSALLQNEDTRAQTAAYLEKSASRIFNFGHDNDEGMGYLDLYDFLSRLQTYLTYGQRTAAGNAKAAALYQTAAQTVSELLQVPFVAYRGGVFSNSYIQEEEATYAENLLPMDASGATLSGLWSKLGYDYLCGVTVYFPRSNSVTELGSYEKAGLFPGYIEMLNRYLQITRSKEHLDKYTDAASKLVGNYSPIFQEMKVEDCKYVDKNGVEQNALALRVTFNPEPDPAVTNGLDSAAVFIQTVKSFDVAVLRSVALPDENGFVDPSDKSDILIARSEALYPGEGMTGKVSVNEESGELNDTSGFAFDLRPMKINGHLVTYSEDSKGTLSDWGLAHSKEKKLETVLRDKEPEYSNSWRLNFSGLDGVVYTTGSGGGKQDAILIFGKDEEKNLYNYEGAVLMSSDNELTWIPNSSTTGISLYHYKLNENKTDIQRAEETIDSPTFSWEGKEFYDYPTMTLVSLTNPEGTGIASQDYNRFALEITTTDGTTSVYAPESAIYNSDQYGETPVLSQADIAALQSDTAAQEAGRKAQSDEMNKIQKEIVQEDDVQENDVQAKSASEEKPAPAQQLAPAEKSTSAEGTSEQKAEPSADTTTVTGAPADNTAAADPSVADTPAADTPVTDTPVTDPPAANTPLENTPAADPPAENAPAENPPAENGPAENPPAENGPAADTPVENAPETNLPTDTVSTENPVPEEE